MNNFNETIILRREHTVATFSKYSRLATYEGHCKLWLSPSDLSWPVPSTQAGGGGQVLRFEGARSLLHLGQAGYISTYKTLISLALYMAHNCTF
jgi:hypothetical protein